MELGKHTIYWIEACVYPDQKRIGRHQHDFFHFIYVEEGTADMTVENEEFTVKPGELYLTPPDMTHGFINRNKTPLKTLEIKFSLEDEETRRRIARLPLCMNVKNSPVKSLLLSMYRESFSGRTLSGEIVSLNFQLLLVFLLRADEETAFAERPNHYPEEIHTALRYMRENLTEEITLDCLADLTGFEKNYFLRKFKKATLRTPMTFLREIRIEKAKELLCYSDMNISQIATVTGFKTVHHFSNVFLKTAGVRPLNYREENATMQEV